MKKSIQYQSIIILTLIVFGLAAPQEAKAAQRALNIVGDKSFSTSNLTPQVKTAHDAFKAFISGVKSGSIKPYPNPVSGSTGATSGDLYMIGRVTGPYIADLLYALRVTGDLAYLDEVASVMGKIEGTLDWSGGSPGLHWLQDKNSIYYGTKYNHVMDNQLTLAALVDATYGFYMNRNNGSNYQALATKWLNILKQWDAHVTVYKGLFHPYNQFTKYQFQMYKMTGEAKYLNEFNKRQPIIQKTMGEGKTTAGEAGIAWDHFVVGDSFYPYECQLNRYVSLTIQAMLTMHFEKAGMFADKTLMEKIMRTIRDDNFKGKYQLPYDICAGNNSYGIAKTTSAIENNNIIEHKSHLNFAYFDTSGSLSSIINANPKKNSFYYYGWLILSAARGATVNPPTIPPTTVPTPTTRPTVTPTVRPSPTPTGGSTSTPRPTNPPSGLTGDANGDGRIDGIDYVIWLLNYKTDTNSGSSVGDFDRSNRVNMDDFVLWRSLYN